MNSPYRPAPKTDNKGVILVSMVIIMLALTVSALAISTFAINHFARTTNQVIAANSLLAAEAGAEQTLHQLNQNSDFSGFNSQQELFNNSVQGRGTYQTAVTNGSLPNQKFITATGRVYRRSGDTTPETIRKVRLTVVGTTATNFAVQTGPGGLLMSSSATIANGDVYVNGYLTMANSSKIGTPLTPAKLWVAHNNCPTAGGPTFPTQCTSGQPITLTNSAHIYGEVRATNQTNGNGMSNPGLIAGSSAPTVALPPHLRVAQAAAVTSTITGAAASCGGSQTRIYQANTKITGNVTINNSCSVTVKGNVWITGNLTLSNSSSLKVDNLLTTAPDVMVDGSGGVKFSNSSAIVANPLGKGFNFIAYYSTAACSPDCADVTGSDLYNSRNIVTVQLGNSALGAGSSFYARWSRVNITNSGTVGSVIGQSVHLANSGNIVFGTSLSSGVSVWSIKTYQQIFD